MENNSPPLNIENNALPDSLATTLNNLTLCDYFAIIGFDKTTGLQVTFLTNF